MYSPIIPKHQFKPHPRFSFASRFLLSYICTSHLHLLIIHEQKIHSNTFTAIQQLKINKFSNKISSRQFSRLRGVILHSALLSGRPHSWRIVTTQNEDVYVYIPRIGLHNWVAFWIYVTRLWASIHRTHEDSECVSSREYTHIHTTRLWRNDRVFVVYEVRTVLSSRRLLLSPFSSLHFRR